MPTDDPLARAPLIRALRAAADALEAWSPPTTPPTDRADRQLLRVGEAAAVLGLGEATVYRLIRRGELVSVAVGHSRRVSRAALEAYVRTLEERATTRRG